MSATKILRGAVNGSGQLTAEIVTVTPEMAALWLTRNGRNRRLDTATAQGLAAAIGRGEFKFDGNAICWDRDNNLLNGQHRLQAVVLTGVSLPFLVVRGLDPESQDVMDTGRRRSLADCLYIRGEKNSKSLATMLRGTYAYHLHGTPATAGRVASMTSSRGLDLLSRLPEMRDFAGGAPAPVGMTRSQGCLLRFLFSQADADSAVEFFSLMDSGAGLADGHPVLALRDRLARVAGQRHPIHARTLYSWSIRCFNAFRYEEDVFRLISNWGTLVEIRDYPPNPAIMDEPSASAGD